MFRIVHRPESETDHAEGVPDAGVPWRPPQRFFETRARQLVLAPGCRAQPPLPRARRIAWRNLGGSVVEIERLVVAVGELERMAELDPR